MVVDLVKKPRLTLKGRRTSSFSFAFQSCSELQEELNAVGYAEEPDLLGIAQPCGYFYVHLCVLPLVRLRQQQMANVPSKNVPFPPAVRCEVSCRRLLQRNKKNNYLVQCKSLFPKCEFIDQCILLKTGPGAVKLIATHRLGKK